MNQIALWAVLLAGLVLALVLGAAVGSSDLRFIAVVLASIPLALVLINLKTNIWVLIPIGWYFTGRLPFMPLPLTIRDMCILVALGAFTLFVALRVVPWRRKLGTLDYLIFINLAYLATVYFRNPVGAWAFQSQMVGGRPYFEVLLAFGSFLVLSRVNPSPLAAKLFPLFLLVPAGILAVLDVVARLVPQAAYPIAMIYSGAGSLSPLAAQEETRVGETRLTGLKNLGLTGVLALCAKYNPITLLSPLYPFRAFVFLSLMAAIFLSGFRATLLFAMLTFVLAALLRKRLADLWIAGAMMLLGLTVLVSLQGAVLQLPLTMQRALSWLPGDWNSEAIESAEGSTRWRWEMVEWAIEDERILRDKVWGQGFGFTIDELNIIAAAMTSGVQGGGFVGGSDREQFIITGTFHNGPISAVKYVGVVGLVLYLVLILYLSVQAWKLCSHTIGTPAFPLALFVGIPVIYFPFAFIILTGFYEVDLPNTIFAAGLLNLTGNYFRNLQPQALVGQRGAAKTVHRHRAGAAARSTGLLQETAGRDSFRR